MEIFAKNKGILGVVAIFIVAMFIYNSFFKSDNSALSSELRASSIGDDLLQIRAELQAVTFNRAIFTSAGYLLLNDFSVSIPEQTTGRSNPFDIIGRD
ncbi:MAG: hypothetical protein WD896_01315 [Parcubacteria group bacterium]